MAIKRKNASEENAKYEKLYNIAEQELQEMNIQFYMLCNNNEWLKRRLSEAEACISECEEAFSSRCHDKRAEKAIEELKKNGIG